MKARAKVKISIGEVKEQTPNKENKDKNSFRKAQHTQHTNQTQTSSSEELSPTHFLSVSKLKSSIQNIFS